MSHTRRDVLQMLAAGAPLAALPLTGTSSPPHLDRWLEPESKASSKFDVANPVHVTEVDYQLPGAWRLATAVNTTTNTITLTTQPDDALINGGWAVVEPFSIRCEIRRITAATETGDANDVNNPPQRQLTLDGNLTPTHAANVAVLWTSVPLWDITLFGAKVDGSTNDAPSLNAAIHDANRAGGGVVRIPPGTTAIELDAATLNQGTYPLSTYRAVTLKSGVTIEGAGDASVLRLTSTGKTGFRALFHNPATRIDNVTFRNFKVDMNATQNVYDRTTVERSAFLAVTEGLNIRIENMTFVDIDCVNFLWFTRHSNAQVLGDIWIKDCRFYLSTTVPASYYHDCSLIYFNPLNGSCRVSGCEFYGVLGSCSSICAVETHAPDTIMEDCYVQDFNTPIQQGGVNKIRNETYRQIFERNRFVNAWHGMIMWNFDGTLVGDAWGDDSGNAVRDSYIKILDNFIGINLNAWAQVLGAMGTVNNVEAQVRFHNRARGVWFNQGSTQSYENIIIAGNDITYSELTADTANYHPADSLMAGILINPTTRPGYTAAEGDTEPSLAADIYKNIVIRNNIIRNAPSAGIFIQSSATSKVVMQGYAVKDNIIVNPGNYPTGVSDFPTTSIYRAGIYFAPHSGSSWQISGNQIYSDRLDDSGLPAPRMQYGIYGTCTGTIQNFEVLDNTVQILGGESLPAYQWAGITSSEAPFVRMRSRMSPWAAPTFRAKYGSTIINEVNGREYHQRDASPTYNSGSKWTTVITPGATSLSLGSALMTFQGLPTLRGFWPMSERILVTQAAADWSRVAGDLTNNGSISFAETGLVSYATLNGSTQYFSVGDTGAYDAGAAVTLGGWFYTTSIPATTSYAFCKWNTASQRSYALLFSTGGAPLISVSADGTSSVSTWGGVVSLNKWYFIVGRYDSNGALHLFVADPDDGNILQAGSGALGKFTVPTGTVPTTGLYNSTAEVTVGALSGGIGNHWAGRVALPFLSLRVLSDDIIENLYNQSRALFM